MGRVGIAAEHWKHAQMGTILMFRRQEGEVSLQNTKNMPRRACFGCSAGGVMSYRHQTPKVCPGGHAFGVWWVGQGGDSHQHCNVLACCWWGCVR